MQRLVKAATGLCALVLLAGYGGALHPAADSLAVFRQPLLALLAALLLLSSWPRLFRWPAAALALVVLAQHTLPPGDPAIPAPAPVTLYQQNLLFSRSEDADWIAAVDAAAPDVLTVQEVSARNRAMLERLSDTLPHQVFCRFGGVGGVAVLTRLSPAPGGRTLCAEGDGLAAMEVMTDEGPLWIASLHLHWPWPYGQAEQIDRLIPLLSALDGPVLLAGDFNAVGWSHSVARIARAIDAGPRGPGVPTFTLPGLPMPVGIDHVLPPGGWQMAARRAPRLGSDHWGVVARLSVSGARP